MYTYASGPTQSAYHSQDDVSDSKGFVAIPSKYRELAKFELKHESSTGWRGYSHHRWIFDSYHGELLAYPKLSWIDYDPMFDDIADSSDN
eukprot:2447150-Amphidinium_carterae.1